MLRKRAWVAMSSGKDSVWALHETRRRGELEVAGLLATLTETFRRVSMHGVRESLLDRQAEAIGLPCYKAQLPWPCSNGEYERAMAKALEAARAQGVTHLVFGDLFLAEVRAYRERMLAQSGIEPSFPLFGRDTAELAREMLKSGLEAHLVCVDPRRLDGHFAGRRFDEGLIAELPPGVDPCGENGEFHTFVSAGPVWKSRIAVVAGEIVTREGFVFADLKPAPTVHLAIEEAKAADRACLGALLEGASLPSSDLDLARQRFFVARLGNEPVGCVGLEMQGTHALLRSLAVRADRRDADVGTRLCERAIAFARHAGLTSLCLLTTSAEEFFARKGFRRTSREELADLVGESEEVRSLCPKSAVPMKLVLVDAS